MSLKIMELFHSNGVIAYALPDHTSGKTQPCDLRLFGQFKRNLNGTTLDVADPYNREMFSYNSAVVEDTGMVPFEIDLGWNPKSPLGIVTNLHAENETVSQFKECLKETLNDAKLANELAKADQSARSCFKFHPHSYKPRDRLWI